MASVTLAESAKLSQDLLVAGVIENVVTVNPIFQIMPFDQIEGNALAYNRENALGDVQTLGVGDTITAKAAATFTPVTALLKTLIGDAEVDHFIQTTRSNINDQKAVQIASKAKSLGRKYQDLFINGNDGTDANAFDGLLQVVSAGQKTTPSTNGDVLSFAIMDELLDKVKAKDGDVDFMMMNSRTLRSYFALLRALGGASIGETITLPNGRQQPGYRGTPIFRNDYIPINQTQGTSTNATTIFAGCWDDGSRKVGITGLTPMVNSGIFVSEVGEAETKNELITRVRFYCGLAVFSDLALAAAPGITN